MRPGPAKEHRGTDPSVTAELFDVLGTPAWMGQTFRDGADLPGAEPTVVVSHQFWQRLGADPSIIGRRLLLGGAARTVIGVMPPASGFQPRPLTCGFRQPSTRSAALENTLFSAASAKGWTLATCRDRSPRSPAPWQSSSATLRSGTRPKRPPSRRCGSTCWAM